MALTRNKEVAALLDLVEEAQWPTRTSRSQVLVYPPTGGSPVVIGLHTGDWRAPKNSASLLRRAGLYDAVDACRAAQDNASRGTTRRVQLAALQQIESIDTGSGPGEGVTDMAKSDRELLELVERCEKVEWPVRRIGGTTGAHILITPPGHRPITVAISSKVRNYPTQILTKLTRAGLLDAENKMSVDHEEDRQRRLREDRERNDRLMPEPEPEDVDDEDTDSAPAAEAIVADKSVDAPGGVTEIGGIAVAEWDYAKTPIGAIDKKTVELLLEDGSIHYSCLLGDFVGATWQSVSKHRKYNHPELLGKAARAKLEAAEAAKAAAQAVADKQAEQAKPVPPVAAPVVVTPAPVQPTPAVRVVERNPQPVLFSAAAEVPPAPVKPAVLRVAPAPPAALAAVSSIAAASVSRRPAPSAPAPVLADPAFGGVDLPAMLARMRSLAEADAERTRLAAELARLQQENQRMSRELDTARQQGAHLADECIAKDNTIRRLREKIDADAKTVAAASELQQLMATLMNGAPAVNAAA